MVDAIIAWCTAHPIAAALIIPNSLVVLVLLIEIIKGTGGVAAACYQQASSSCSAWLHTSSDGGCGDSGSDSSCGGGD